MSVLNRQDEEDLSPGVWFGSEEGPGIRFRIKVSARFGQDEEDRK